MNLTIGDKLGAGAYGSVYSATDDFGRPVAVKVIRKSGGDHDFVVSQAKALAKVKSPYVVHVLYFEMIEDPESGLEATAIVMELIDGKGFHLAILEELDEDRIKEIGLQLCDGIGAIHAAGLTHADIHDGNVLVTSDSLKIIDILYRTSLKIISTRSREERVKIDIDDARRMLRRLLERAETIPAIVDRFLRQTSSSENIAGLKTAFESAFDDEELGASDALAQAIARFTDSAFVKSKDYAAALLTEIPTSVRAALLTHVITQKLSEPKHRILTGLIWSSLTEEEKKSCAAELNRVLLAEVPNGSFEPPLRIVVAAGAAVWSLLPRATQIRLEHAITNDVAQGIYNVYGLNTSRRGHLGVWARLLFELFEDRSQLVTNICRQLRASWNDQNYIGEYFMEHLHRIAKVPADRDAMIDALKSAVRDNAHRVKSNLTKLPALWQSELVDE